MATPGGAAGHAIVADVEARNAARVLAKKKRGETKLVAGKRHYRVIVYTFWRWLALSLMLE
jgi:hypothetical protein